MGCPKMYSTSSPCSTPIHSPHSDVLVRWNNRQWENQISLNICRKMKNKPKRPTHVGKVVIVNGGASFGQTKGKLVSGADEEMISYATAHLLLVLIAIVAAFPAGVLIESGKKIAFREGKKQQQGYCVKENVN